MLGLLCFSSKIRGRRRRRRRRKKQGKEIRMGSSLMLMMSRWVALSICFIVVVVKLDMALCAERPSNHVLWDYVAPPVWKGFCKATENVLAGYECREYQVKTKDGFILGVSRVPHGRSGSGSGGKRPAVIVQHGVMADSMQWMLGATEESLIVVLADSGFDVWVSNTRGTRFSSRHESLHILQPEYWNWSWDEIAVYDLPAVVDFVAQQTGQKVHYVGHSMGTTTVMAALSQGLLANQLLSAALLCPVAYLDQMTFGIGRLSINVFLGEITRLVGVYAFAPGEIVGLLKFVPQTRIFYNILEEIKKRTGVDLNHVWTSFIAENCCINGSAILKWVNYVIQPTATKTLVHFSQTFRDGVVAKYDYGTLFQNTQHYGQPRPPLYNLGNIPKNMPLYIGYGSNDELASVKDVEHLLKDLQSHDKDKLTTNLIKGYGHIDFVIGINAKEVAYDPMIKFLKLHTPGLNHQDGNTHHGHVGL